MLAEDMFSSGAAGGELIANELSAPRRARLRETMADYLPTQLSIRVTGFDGSKWGLHEAEAFDRILLDAPCSGERHQLQAGITEWSEKTTKRLAIRQYALLASAWMALKPGGRLVYSTCSISPAENDAVIAKLLKRKSGEVGIANAVGSTWSEPEWRLMIETTEHGFLVLPDRSNGAGPIFFAVLDKVEGLPA